MILLTTFHFPPSFQTPLPISILLPHKNSCISKDLWLFQGWHLSALRNYGKTTWSVYCTKATQCFPTSMFASLIPEITLEAVTEGNFLDIQIKVSFVLTLMLCFILSLIIWWTPVHSGFKKKKWYQHGNLPEYNLLYNIRCSIMWKLLIGTKNV